MKVSQSNFRITGLMFAMMESGQSPDPTGVGPDVRRGIHQSCNFRHCLRHVHTHAPYPLLYRQYRIILHLINVQIHLHPFVLR